jgi:hypothetical protein
LLVRGEQLKLPRGAVPREVETVVSHRTINDRHLVAGVSGGVMVAPSDVLRAARTTDSAERTITGPPAPPKNLAAGVWWWDAPK